jgi:hypothetical protein
MSLTKVTYSMIQGAAANVLDYGADKTGATDSSAAFTAALAASTFVFIPKGTYKLLTTVTLPAATTIFGTGRFTIINAWGCDAFTVVGGTGDGVSVSSMSIMSYSDVGVADPKLYAAIYCAGTASDYVNNFIARDLYLQGWLECINWSYAWTSRLDNVSTVNCTHSVTMVGLSVNDSINNCSLVANSGTSSVNFVADGSVTGEGLVISNSLLSGGGYGIDGASHLALCVTNCIIDLVSNVGINVLNPIALLVSNSWIYATNIGINFQALGSPSPVSAGISNCHITTTAASSKGIVSHPNNVGVSITGGSIAIPASGSYNVYGLSDDLLVAGVDLVNPAANPSVYFEYGVNCNFVGCSGNTKFSYVNGNPPKMGIHIAPFKTTLTYSASMTPDCLDGSLFSISISDAAAFTINTPTNTPDTGAVGEITFAIFNQSGGAAGVATWDSDYRMAGAWVQPATGKLRTITFKYWAPDYWLEVARTDADLPA